MQDAMKDVQSFGTSIQSTVNCRKGIPGLLDLPDSPRRAYCGDIDIFIDKDGTWFHEGSPFTRKDLVCMFASVLRRDIAGDYWLATPAELGRIQVEDVPFLAIEMFVEGEGNSQIISFRTNVDEMVTVDEEHPIYVINDPETGEVLPYVTVRNNMDAKLSRAVYYELVSRVIEERTNGITKYGVWSSNQFFPMEPPSDG